MLMKLIPNRIVIYVKDIQNITGRSERTSQKMMTAMRKKYNKKRGEFITAEEFCNHTGLKEEDVRPFLM